MDNLELIIKYSKEILKSVEKNDEFLVNNIKFCYDNMSEGTIKVLLLLLKEFIDGYSILSVEQIKYIDIIKKIANIFYSDGQAHGNPRVGNIHISYKCERYAAILFYEKAAIMGDYSSYFEAARTCSDMGYVNQEERNKKEIDYYNKAARKGVFEAFRYCEFMPELFDKLIVDFGSKFNIAYYFRFKRNLQYKKARKYLEIIKTNCSIDEKLEVAKELSRYNNNIDMMAIQYINGEIDNFSPKVEKSGCFVATYVYGSYNCPQVWVLRRYRDDKLAKSIFGRLFIKVYYMLSPKLIMLFGNNDKFSHFLRNILK